jgi:hypothetical protein
MGANHRRNTEGGVMEKCVNIDDIIKILLGENYGNATGYDTRVMWWTLSQLEIQQPKEKRDARE